MRVLIVFILLNVIGLGAFWFGYSSMGTKKDEEAKLRQELADEKQKSTQFIALEKILRQAEKEGGALDKHMYSPSEESQIAFISAIEELGIGATGLRIETKSLELVQGAEPSFRGTFSLKGTWKEVYSFLRLIEEFPARIIIRNFSVSSSGAINDTMSLWEGSISIDLTSLRSS